MVQMEWECPDCAYLNEGQSNICEICEYSRPETESSSPPPAAPVAKKEPPKEAIKEPTGETGKLESDLKQAHDQIKKLSSENEELQTKLKQNAVKEVDVTTLKVQIDTLEKENTNLSNQISSLKKAADDVTDCDNLQNEVNSLKTTLTDTEKEITRQQTVIKTLEGDLQQTESEKVSLTMEIKELQSSKGDDDKLQSEITILKDSNLKITKELETVLSETGKQNADLSNEINILKENLKESNTNLDNARQETDQLKLSTSDITEITTLQERLKQSDTQLISVNKEKEALQQQLNDLTGDDSQSEITTLQQQLNDVSKNNTTLQQQLSDQKSSSESEISQLQSEIKKLENSLQNASESTKTLLQQVEDSKTTNDSTDMQSEITSLKQTLLETTSELETLKPLKANLTNAQNQINQLTTAAGDVGSLQKSLQESSTKLDAAVALNETQQQEINHLKSSSGNNSQLESEITTLRQSLEESKKELNGESEKVITLQQQIDQTNAPQSLQEELTDAKEENTILQQQLQQQRESNTEMSSDLEGKLKEANTELELLRESSNSSPDSNLELRSQMLLLQESLNQSQSELNPLTLELTDVKQQLSSRDLTITDLRSEVQLLKSTYAEDSSVSSELVKAAGTIRQLQNENCDLLAKLATAHGNATSTKQISELTKDINTMRTEATASRKENVSLYSQIAQLRKEVTSLKKKASTTVVTPSPSASDKLLLLDLETTTKELEKECRQNRKLQALVKTQQAVDETNKNKLRFAQEEAEHLKDQNKNLKSDLQIAHEKCNELERAVSDVQQATEAKAPADMKVAEELKLQLLKLEKDYLGSLSGITALEELNKESELAHRAEVSDKDRQVRLLQRQLTSLEEEKQLRRRIEHSPVRADPSSPVKGTLNLLEIERKKVRKLQTELLLLCKGQSPRRSASRTPRELPTRGRSAPATFHYYLSHSSPQPRPSLSSYPSVSPAPQRGIFVSPQRHSAKSGGIHRTPWAK